MKAAVKAAWEAATGHEMSSHAETAWLAVCDAIVDYIQSEAQVTVSVPGVTAGGVTVPGTGTVA